MAKNFATQAVLDVLDEFKQAQQRSKKRGDKPPGFMDETGRGRRRKEPILEFFRQHGYRMKYLR